MSNVDNENCCQKPRQTACAGKECHEFGAIRQGKLIMSTFRIDANGCARRKC
jgi:hypothetical protein